MRGYSYSEQPPPPLATPQEGNLEQPYRRYATLQEPSPRRFATLQEPSPRRYATPLKEGNLGQSLSPLLHSPRRGMS